LRNLDIWTFDAKGFVAMCSSTHTNQILAGSRLQHGLGNLLASIAGICNSKYPH
jgi:hypothetical protein